MHNNSSPRPLPALAPHRSSLPRSSTRHSVFSSFIRIAFGFVLGVAGCIILIHFTSNAASGHHYSTRHGLSAFRHFHFLSDSSAVSRALSSFQLKSNDTSSSSISSSSQSTCPQCTRTNITESPTCSYTPFQSPPQLWPTRSFPTSFSPLPIHRNCLLESNGEFLPRNLSALELTNGGYPEGWKDTDPNFGGGNLKKSFKLQYRVNTAIQEKKKKSEDADECIMRDFDVDDFLRSLKGKTIAFYGDSLIRQLFGQLTIALHNKLVYSSELIYHNPSNRKQYFKNPVREYYYEGEVTLKNQWVTGHGGNGMGLSHSMAPFLLQSDLLIVNVGAFHGNREDLEQNIRNFYDFLKIKQYAGQVIWREYSPCHFDTEDGEFIQDRNSSLFEKQLICIDNKDNRVIDNQNKNWRLTVSNGLAEKYNVPIMRIYNVSAHHPDLHLTEFKDCRHWYFPSYLLESWVTLLYNIIRK